MEVTKAWDGEECLEQVFSHPPNYFSVIIVSLPSPYPFPLSLLNTLPPHPLQSTAPTNPSFPDRHRNAPYGRLHRMPSHPRMGIQAPLSTRAHGLPLRQRHVQRLARVRRGRLHPLQHETRRVARPGQYHRRAPRAGETAYILERPAPAAGSDGIGGGGGEGVGVAGAKVEGGEEEGEGDTGWEGEEWGGNTRGKGEDRRGDAGADTGGEGEDWGSGAEDVGAECVGGGRKYLYDMDPWEWRTWPGKEAG